MASKVDPDVGVNGGYLASRAPIYVVARKGVEVRSRRSMVEQAQRLTQVVRLGVTGKQARSRVTNPAPTIQVMG